MDEQQAVQRLKHGDIAGLEFLVERHQVRAVRTAYLITRDPGLAEDVVQDSFLRAFRSIHSFDAARPFGPWFLRSVVHAALKAAQEAARQVPAGEEADEFRFAELAARVESVESQVEQAEARRALWEAMQSLSPRQRAAIVQRYYLGLSEKEMALELQAAPGTVKWLLNAARERLRRLLAERSEE